MSGMEKRRSFRVVETAYLLGFSEPTDELRLSI